MIQFILKWFKEKKYKEIKCGVKLVFNYVFAYVYAVLLLAFL